MILEFTTKLESSTIELYYDDLLKKDGDNHNTVDPSDMYITYSIEFEIREYGIKSVYITVSKADFTVSQDEYEDVEGFENTFSIKDFDVEVLKDNMTPDFLSITSVEVDFEDYTLKFY